MTPKFLQPSSLMGGGSLLAIALATQLAATPAFAQEAAAPAATPAPAPAQAPALPEAAADQPASAVGEIVVTGSRIQSGFTTPTPVTVSTAQDLKNLAPTNLAEGLVQLPVFQGSLRTSQTTGGGLLGGAGQNLLNLRNLGSNRVLVLLNGTRVVSTNDEGSTDINVFPQNLVSRVDVVTGGASAAYGSDAVAGVVNFVLDTKFEGLKGEVQSGVSTYGDAASYSANIAFGRSFLDGRLHLVGSAEYYHQLGVGIDKKPTGRDWQDHPWGQLPNTLSSTPQVVIAPNFRSGLGSTGGVVTAAGPLRGLAFGQNGQPYQYQFGQFQGNFMSGGDPLAGDVSTGLVPDQTRQTAFLHGEFEVTPDVTLFAEALQARTHVDLNASWNFATGAGNQLTIFRDNAYLPASVQQQMIAANVQSFPLGRYFNEWDPQRNESLVTVTRGSFGARGNIFGRWQWDTSFTWGRSLQRLAKLNLPNLRNIFAASDAVRAPNGQIVCRSTLAGFDPGCVPFNPFGVASASAAARDFVMGDSIKWLELNQTVIAANLSGDLGDKLQLGAGPISVATGLEYRKESANQTSDFLSQSTVTNAGLRAGVMPNSVNGRVGAFQFFNPQPLAGSFNLKEGYVEVGVPVVRDLPFAQLFDVSLAARHADYSQSGGVTTWKYGFNWQVNDDIRLRYTKSRDIRGPSILELFNSLTQINSTLVNKGATIQSRQLTSGNPDLTPERGLTETYGVVYRPSWFRGFQVSLDRYKISISDAIGSLGAQTTLDQCNAGNPLACEQVIFEPDGRVTVFLKPLNLSVQEAAGYDLEAAYSTRALDGALTVRALVNKVTSGFRTAPGSPPVLSLDSPGTPKWRATFSVNYERDNWALFVSERIIGAAKIDPNREQGVFTNDNLTPVMGYLNLTARYKFSVWGKRQEAYVSVQNVLNARPPVSAGNPTSYNTSVNYAYDTMGRYFTAGLKMALQ